MDHSSSGLAEPQISQLAAASLQRQTESLHAVVKELSVTEDRRQERLTKCIPKERKQLEKRFNAERKQDAGRVMRMKEETDRMRELAEKGQWKGTARDMRPAGPPKVGDKEVTGMQARGTPLPSSPPPPPPSSPPYQPTQEDSRTTSTSS
jgi:hypothetical protein